MTAVKLVSEVTNCIDSANSFLERKRRQREGGGPPEGGGLSASGGFSGGGTAPSVFAQLSRPSRQGSPPSFDTVDMNHDGVITRNEYNVALSGEVPPPPPTARPSPSPPRVPRRPVPSLNARLDGAGLLTRRPMKANTTARTFSPDDGLAQRSRVLRSTRGMPGDAGLGATIPGARASSPRELRDRANRLRHAKSAVLGRPPLPDGEVRPSSHRPARRASTSAIRSQGGALTLRAAGGPPAADWLARLSLAAPLARDAADRHPCARRFHVCAGAGGPAATGARARGGDLSWDVGTRHYCPIQIRR
jgi:hypothetical protein